MLIDYETHLEVLASNLLLGSEDQHNELLSDANLKKIHSFRCIIQLNHEVTPNVAFIKNSRKGIQLTNELEGYIDNLRRCATCYNHDPKTDTYIFDFWVNTETETAFQEFWNTSFDLYTSLHKLAMLNDLAIPKRTRNRFRQDTKTRRFASRLPEPQDEDKIFRFEQVCFLSNKSGKVVDYVSLSDVEHQLEQLLGTFCMVSAPNVIFLLDEPESHFNPVWRVKFFSRILDIPTFNGMRRDVSKVSEQECLITTHSPFIPSDMPREKVFIFSKDEKGKIIVTKPQIETYGSTFDTILEECFGIRPPISDLPKEEINELMQSSDPTEILEGINRLGNSVEKMFLADRLRQIKAKNTK